ncbi:MFS transporter [Planomonospora venezuelensis]|uniref:MFS family permease n=1 Tax=Planomonospora venezuelensis TaxID=1999 RepID=A0A841DEI7_PLAVE|nr:MFS transporter [Planomonospora venezuelensis]MBB5967889.1 MFS family permease [Planomonospora venezuelensis]
MTTTPDRTSEEDPERALGVPPAELAGTALPGGAAPGRSVFADPDFRRLFAAAAMSRLGTSIGHLAVPLAAVTALAATPGELGVLAMLSTLAFLLIGLPAGVWVDRLRRRPVMVVADLVRAALLASVPLAWWLGALTFAHLCAVVLVCGFATVFFEIADQSYLPQLVGPDRLTAANTALVSMDAANQLAGRGIGGLLIQLLSAPAAILVDALSYLWSAVCLRGITRAEPPPARGERTSLPREVGQGLGMVAGHPILRAIAVEGALTNLAIQIVQTVLPLVFVRELGLSPLWFGVFLTAGGVGFLLGSAGAARLGRRFGESRVVWLTSVAVVPFAPLIPLVDAGAGLWLAGAGWMAVTYKVGVANVIKVGFRQRVTPGRLLGRVTATMRFMFTGALAIGAGAAGLIGELAGTRAALWAGAAVLAVSFLPIMLSPLRTLRDLPDGAGGAPGTPED